MIFGPAKPYVTLIYRGVDITAEIDPMLISVSYTDHHHGEVDEIDVEVHDKDGRWKGSWEPQAGDIMNLTFFDGWGGVLPCGDFELDEPDFSGGRGGDIMTARGLAAPVTKSLRTEKTHGYDDQDLSAIVNQVAGRAGLSVEGDIQNLPFERVTQRRERDLEFLTRLAEDTGHYFTIKGTKAIFTSFKSVDGQSPAFATFHGDHALTDYNFKRQTSDTYSKAKVSYLDPDKKETTRHEEVDADIKTADELKISGERVESPKHAEAMAKSKLHFANRKSVSGSIDMVGNVKMLAGNTFELLGMGNYSDTYLLDTTTHAMTRGGYTSSGEFLNAREK